MLSNRTLFILGAGASKPYGFPTGLELRSEILRACRDGHSCFPTLQAASRKSPDQLAHFEKQFRESSIISIDSFLASRPEFTSIGKAAIATILCLFENPESLDPRLPQYHWYMYLWDHLRTAGTLNASSLWRNVRFISFNYDRSLEFFLFRAIRATYNVSPSQALDALTKLELLHVYGQLGNLASEGTLNFADGKSREYEVSNDPADIALAADQLLVIPEARDDAPQFLTARQSMDWAETICFLGFGFDGLNCQRLGLADVLEYKETRGHLPRLLATAMGMKRGEMLLAKTRICGASRNGLLGADDTDCLNALRDWDLWQ